MLAAGVPERDLVDTNCLGRPGELDVTALAGVQLHEGRVIAEVRELLVERADLGDERVHGGQRTRDDLLHVEELPDRLLVGDDLEGHPQQRADLRHDLEPVGEEPLPDVLSLELDAGLLVLISQALAQVEEVAHHAVEPQLGDVLGLEEPALDRALRARRASTVRFQCWICSRRGGTAGRCPG